ncbi:hypothetical protein M8C21_007430 [Ambrosia artemisiifolia]|uniref:Uncharacterized protein n=1 Tax=Ambrosia artemisiifolia TaxID=4212 RepID=A0AAD5CAW5_AMBAR|nr:hypothetical protein M8C21_007430 [Ambrosia artemisiifolia]
MFRTLNRHCSATNRRADATDDGGGFKVANPSEGVRRALIDVRCKGADNVQRWINDCRWYVLAPVIVVGIDSGTPGCDDGWRRWLCCYRWRPRLSGLMKVWRTLLALGINYDGDVSCGAFTSQPVDVLP